MFKKYILIYFVFIFSTITISQTINGTVQNSNNKLLNSTSVTVFLKKGTNEEVVDYKVIYNGVFSFKIKDNYKSLTLLIQAFGYKKSELKIENISVKKQYDFQINLNKDSIISLKEVIIKTNKRFTVKKDTILFNVEAYKDGTERKVVDIIKKLPGIEVNQKTGKIKYNGKFIETVLLEGDDLFGSNYSIGTNNINIDILKGVEAIDKYSKNPLLKGIENSDKVVLNLLLKNKQLDISGNSEVGLGVISDKIANDINANIIAITKKNKNFSTFSYNNVGNNLTPFNYSDSNINIENYDDEALKAPKVISELSINERFDENRSTINNQLFSNLNHLVNINKKTKLKANIFYLNDKITNNQLIKNSIFIDNNSITTFDSISLLKKPVHFQSDFNIKYLPNKSSSLDYDFSLKNEEIRTPTTIVSNNSNFNSNLETKNLFLKQDLVYTKKTKNNNAYQVILKNATNDLKQHYNISSSNSFGSSQNNKSKKNYTEFSSVFFGKDKNDNKYKFIFGGLLNHLDFQSKLEDTPSNLAPSNQSINNINYFTKSVTSSFDYSFKIKKWSFNPLISINLVNQKLENGISDIDIVQNNLLINSSFKTSFKINRVSFITSSISFDKKLNAERYLFENRILIDNRVSIANKPSLNLQESQNISLFYYNTNLYDQFQMNFGFNLNRLKGNFFSNAQINENTIQLTYFFLPEYNSNYNFNFSIAKYLPFIASTIKVTSNYSINNFKNIINNSELRNNYSTNLVNNLFAKTSFNGILNFENNLTYYNSTSRNDTANIQFSNVSINNSFKTIVSSNNSWFSIFSLNYFSPNIENSKNYLFLDSNFSYKKKKYTFGLTAKNILNIKNFEEIQITDFSTSVYQSDILQRYFLIDFTFNF